MSRDSLLGTFEQMVLLAILGIGDGAYPPAVLARIEEITGREVSRGSIYVTLDRLEAKGLVRSSYGEPEPGRGGRPKRFLEVTEAGVDGVREARDWMLGLWRGVEGVP